LTNWNPLIVLSISLAFLSFKIIEIIVGIPPRLWRGMAVRPGVRTGIHPEGQALSLRKITLQKSSFPTPSFRI